VGWKKSPVLPEFGNPAGPSIHPKLPVKTVESLRETISSCNLAAMGIVCVLRWGRMRL
jgi:hypothetical protein